MDAHRSTHLYASDSILLKQLSPQKDVEYMSMMVIYMFFEVAHASGQVHVHARSLFLGIQRIPPKLVYRLKPKRDMTCKLVVLHPPKKLNSVR